MNTNSNSPIPQLRFLDLVRERIRLRHLSYKTEQHYIGWIRRFILFHGKRHPKNMGEEEIVAFLSDLAIKRNCAPGTQNQALNALVFLFRNVLDREIGKFKSIIWARRKQRVPPFFKEVATLLLGAADLLKQRCSDDCSVCVIVQYSELCSMLNVKRRLSPCGLAIALTQLRPNSTSCVII